MTAKLAGVLYHSLSPSKKRIEDLSLLHSSLAHPHPENAGSVLFHAHRLKESFRDSLPF